MTEDSNGDIGAGVEMFGVVSAAAVVSRHASRAERELGRGPDLLDPETIVAGFTGFLSGYRARGGGDDGSIAFPSARPGDTVEASLWIHNPSERPSGQVTLNAGGFVSARGDEIPNHLVVPQPASLEIAAADSAEIVWRLSVPTNQPGGWYHGLLFASILPDAPAVARVLIRP